MTTNDFGEALRALVRARTEGLSPNVIGALKGQWADVYSDDVYWNEDNTWPCLKSSSVTRSARIR